MHNEGSCLSTATLAGCSPAASPRLALPVTAPAAAAPAAGVFAVLIPPVQRALREEGYTTPTPIQEQTIRHLLAGRDLLGCAQTGTGKTAAFALPMLQHFSRGGDAPLRGRPRALVLAPTRELATQILQSMRTYGRHLRLSHTAIFGGVGQGAQVAALGRGVHVAVATPGRLLDLMEQGHVRLDAVEIFVLDEADRMMDMGFIRDVRKIIAALPQKRQSLFFSATLTADAVALARSMVRDPVHVTVAPGQPTVERVSQKVMFVDRERKDKLLVSLLSDDRLQRVAVFAQQKHAADKVTRTLLAAGIRAMAIHGNKSQGARTQAMDGFRSGRIRVLVATDIAARGIDVDGVTHVINYHMPVEPETYVHRIGRTARAGADGDAVSFCCSEERDFLRAVERLLGRPVPVDTQHPHHSERARLATGAAARPPPRGDGRPRAPRGSMRGARSCAPAGGRRGGDANGFRHGEGPRRGRPRCGVFGRRRR